MDAAATTENINNSGNLTFIYLFDKTKFSSSN